MKTIRKACVQAVFDEFETRGELVHAFADGDAKAMRPLGHIVGYVDLDVTGIVDLIVDTINQQGAMMALRRIDVETLLTPPEPPKASIVMLGMSGYAVRISPKGGAQLVELLPDGACTLASITAGELETFDYQLHNETGGTR